MILKRLRYLADSLRAIHRGARHLDRMHQLALHHEIERLKTVQHYAKSKSLIPFGAKMYSQADEDGMIREIFKRIGTTNKCFVEFGIGDGLENNTAALLFDDWHGLWIDASTKSIAAIRSNYEQIIKAERLRVVESFITQANIDELIRNNIQHKEIDLLSVDIDGNDFHVLSAITCVNPRVIVIEYNAKFIPPFSYCMDYNESHFWAGGDCFGASLKFLEVKLRERGYCLVGCSLSGANAFFVRQDLAGTEFLEPYTAEEHYQPARYYLTEVTSGHRSSYATLARSFSMRKK